MNFGDTKIGRIGNVLGMFFFGKTNLPIWPQIAKKKTCLNSFLTWLLQTPGVKR
jgi:hypothetical protein